MDLERPGYPRIAPKGRGNLLFLNSSIHSLPRTDFYKYLQIRHFLTPITPGITLTKSLHLKICVAPHPETGGWSQGYIIICVALASQYNPQPCSVGRRRPVRYSPRRIGQTRSLICINAQSQWQWRKRWWNYIRGGIIHLLNFTNFSSGVVGLLVTYGRKLPTRWQRSQVQ